MAAETSEPSPHPSDRTLRDRLVSGVKLASYGLLAAVGTLAVVDGTLKYLDYANGGVNQPTAYVIGVVATLGIGFTLLLLALSGTVARGVDYSNVE